MVAQRALVLLPGEGRNISMAQHRQRQIVVKAGGESTRDACGLAHSFDNHGSSPARYLVIWTPAEAGRYFEELHELERTHGQEPSEAEVADLRRRYQFEYLR
jgi:hypothetical protein